MSRVQLSRLSGLSSAAITNVASELMTEDFICETERPADARNHLGRPASPLYLDTEHYGVTAVEIGSGLLRVAICDLEANILTRETVKIEDGQHGPEILHRAAVLMEGLLAGSDRELLGVGTAAPGMMNRQGEALVSTPGNPVSHGEISRFFKERFHVPAFVEHNVSAMAIAESTYGLGRGLGSLAFIYARAGLGAGLILGGVPYRGHEMGAVEFGHIQVVPDGALCRCGRHGCLETVINDEAFTARLAATGLLADGSGVGDAAAAFLGRVSANDPRALEIRAQMLDPLAGALAVLITIINPQMVVLGGLFHDISDAVCDDLRVATASRIMPLMADRLRIVPTSFGRDAGLIGAASIALSHVLFGDPLLPVKP